VDGVALKQAVNAWASAPDAEKSLVWMIWLVIVARRMQDSELADGQKR
jgi:hypothetical protein